MPVAFPKLGLEVVVERVAFSLGNFHIYWYAVMIGIGGMLGLLYAFRQGKKQGLSEDLISDVVLVAVLTGIVGARSYYVVFRWDYFSQHLQEIVNIRDGGIAIYGGILVGALGMIFYCKWKKAPLLSLMDLGVGSLFLGQGIGRWGNFFNQEAFGSNTNSIFGMISETTQRYLTTQQIALEAQGIIVDPTQPVHPCFFYESVWCLLGFVCLLFYQKHQKFQGELACFYGVWYGLGRFFIEGLRTDSLMIGSFRVSQLVAALCVVVAMGIWIVMRKSKKENLLTPS